MKRLLTILLVFLMAFMLIGCSSSETPDNSNNDVVENNEGDGGESSDAGLTGVPEGLKPLVGKELMFFMRYEGSPQCDDYSDFFAMKLEKMDDSYGLYNDWSLGFGKYYDGENWYVLHEYRPTYDGWMNWSDEMYNSDRNFNGRAWILTSLDEANGLAYFDEIMFCGECNENNVELLHNTRKQYVIELNEKNGYYYAEWLDMGFERIYGGLMEATPIGKLTITADALNVRNKPSKDGDKLAVLDKWYGETFVVDKVEADGYTWYCIGPNWWIADDNGEWVDYAPLNN